MLAGLRYAVSRPDVLWPTILIALYGMFTGNISVTLAVYATSVYDSGPGGYGLLGAIVAVGSLLGALISAHLRRTRLRTLVLFAALLSALYMVSAAAPTQLVFCAVLLGIGASTLLLQTSANSTIQLAAPVGSMEGSWASTFSPGPVASPSAVQWWAISTSMSAPKPACCSPARCPESPPS
ncbi:hypothetical protein AHiyo8_pI68410 (plasmid) [Arthrobacter sp. Hiyo8]|nr:hypothetical protein AHiyo8_pI68410 [Arthrobacter sp. Hiyo8]